MPDPLNDPTGRKLVFVVTEDWFFASHFLPMARAAREIGVADRVEVRAERRPFLETLHALRGATALLLGPIGAAPSAAQQSQSTQSAQQVAVAAVEVEGNRRVTEETCRYCHADVVAAIDPMPGHAGRLDCIGCHRSVGHLH